MCVRWRLRLCNANLPSTIGSVPTETQPRGFNIDPAGGYLLAVGQLSHALSSYHINASTGQLTKLKAYAMGKNPNWVECVDLPLAQRSRACLPT